jgi:hypothetical protein
MRATCHCFAAGPAPASIAANVPQFPDRFKGGPWAGGRGAKVVRPGLTQAVARAEDAG